MAQDVLAAIKKQKEPVLVKDTLSNTGKNVKYTLDKEQTHFLIVVCGEQKKLTDAFRQNLMNFNQLYFRERNFESNTSLLDNKQIVILKTFVDAKDVQGYLDDLNNDADVFKNTYKKEELQYVIVSSDNATLLLKNNDLSGYLNFYKANYLNKDK